MLERVSKQARFLLFLADQESKRLQHSCLGTTHVILGILRQEEDPFAKVPGEEDDEAYKVLKSLGISLDAARAVMQDWGDAREDSDTPSRTGVERPITQPLRDALVASVTDRDHAGPLDILRAILRMPEAGATQLFEELGVSRGEVQAELS